MVTRIVQAAAKGFAPPTGRRLIMAELHYLVYRRMSFGVERVEVAVGVLSIPILAVVSSFLLGPSQGQSAGNLVWRLHGV